MRFASRVRDSLEQPTDYSLTYIYILINPVL
ncbi:hypothetical protein DV733_07635 [Halapricum salinum]|uniref:Uncharacterized protein n=1 Tax=Halapricum salinum TaxID=1457250 RepID=A0A4D6HG16_9EURY|nr:hypothetical protein DV733_07635 [Halapricum salinum]